MVSRIRLKAARPPRTAPAVPAVFPAAAAAPQAASLGVPQGGWCWGAYAAALVFPAAGLTLGLLFSGSSDRVARRFGITCLVLCAAGWTLASLTGWMTDLGLFSSGDGDRYTENYY